MPLDPFFLIIFGALIVSAVLTWVIRRTAFAMGVCDEPVGGRKIHEKRTALWGGGATGTTIVLVLISILPFLGGLETVFGLRHLQVIGFAFGVTILMIGGMFDDAFSLPPWVQFCFPLAASIVIVMSGSGIVQITNPLGGGAWSLVWQRVPLFGGVIISWPADILTVLWLLVVTYAMKMLDGLDGLVAGLTIISALLIAGLASSIAYLQPGVALLALSIAAIHLGFVRFNRAGSIFLGEAGSTIAGFSLGVLSIISGAKVATAAIALGIPIVDIGIVVIGRLARGASPFRGDDTHIHHRLIKAGLSPSTVVRIIWAAAAVFGLAALTMQTKGKIFLLITIAILVVGSSLFAYAHQKTRK
jgi:UDP-N-acetylmuramyl pentapeptide phosphotransferase/UDP-N-acetylglucosamine-1-phosphate transferase